VNPPIGLVVTTYIPPGGEARIRDVITPTVPSWIKHLKYDGDIHVHVADDGSGVFDFGLDFWKRLFSGWPKSITWSTADRQGVGASLNRAHQQLWEISPITLYAVDDWALETDLYLDTYVGALTDESVGCIRLGASMPNLHGGVMRQMPGCWGIAFDRYSYYWSQRPALYHKRFWDAYGKVPENVDALTVDNIYNETMIKNPKGPDVVLAVMCPWVHIPSVELGTVTPVPGQHPPIKYRVQNYKGLRG